MSPGHVRLQHLFAVAGLVLLQLTGCARDSDRPKTVPVRGTVMFDGKPVSSGEVIFIPALPKNKSAESENRPVARPARGEISENGQFQLTSFEPGDGACPGEYIATIFSYKVKPVSGDPRGGVWAIPRTYGNAVTSDLKVTIPTDATEPVEFNFVLEGEADKEESGSSPNIMAVE